MTLEPLEHRNAGNPTVGALGSSCLGHLLPEGNWQLWGTVQCLHFSEKEKKWVRKSGSHSWGAIVILTFSWSMAQKRRGQWSRRIPFKPQGEAYSECIPYTAHTIYQPKL